MMGMINLDLKYRASSGQTGLSIVFVQWLLHEVATGKPR
jgi:hypothetical protein